VPEDFSKFDEFVANDSRPLNLEIESETLPLSLLRPWVKGLEQVGDKATGQMKLSVSGSLAEPKVDANIELKNISSPSQPSLPTTDVTVKIDAADGVAKISAEAVAPDFAPATLNATMPFLPKKWAMNPESLMTEKIEGQLDLPRLDLSRFQSLIPGAKNLTGVTTGKIVIAGTVGDPKVDGNLQLSNGSLKLNGDTIPGLEGVNFDLKTDLNQMTIKGDVKDLEGGSLKINGTIGLKNKNGDGLGEIDVTLKGQGLPVRRNEFIILRANADLSIKGTTQSALVSGNVGIIDSIFYKDIELIPIGKPFLEPSAAKLPTIDTPDNPGEAVPAAFKDWTANVLVKTIDPILIRGNLGEGRVDVALRIEGKLGNPQPNGTVKLSKAAARLPFTTLVVNEGTLTYTPKTGFDPIVDLRGAAEPRPYRVQIYASGRMSDPKLILTSQPPLPENEIMTLLATGTTSSGLENSQQAASRATQLLIEELRRGRFLFGKRLRPVLALLDDVDFSVAESDPYNSDLYNSATLKLSSKWFISAGLGAEGDQRFMAIWRLRFK
jgi:autotransporter translocation and assembly factor TamB